MKPIDPFPRTTIGLRRPWMRLATALVAIATVATACGGDGDRDDTSKRPSDDSTLETDPANCPVDALDQAEGPVKITVWHAYNALTQEAIEKAASDYNASQSKVEVSVEAQGSYEELLKKYEDRLGDPAGLPDGVFSEDTTLRFMVDSGSVIAAADCIAADPSAEEFYDDLLPVVSNAYSIKKILWPSAFGMSMPIMYVNNDHLRAAGLDPDNPPETLDEVRAAAEKIKAADIGGLEAPLVMQLFGWYPENWLTGAGQTIVNESNGHTGLATESTADNKYTRKIFNWLQGMQKDELLKAYPKSNGIDQFLALGNRTSSILIDGSRSITSVSAIVQNSYEGDRIEGTEGIDPDDLKGLDVAVVPVPGLKEAGQGGAAGSAAFVVAGSDPVKIAATWDFMKFFNSPPVQVQWTIQGSYMPVTTKVQNDPKIIEYFTTDPAGKWLSVVNEQFRGVNPDFASPVIGPYDRFRSGLQSALERAVLGGADVDSTINKFNSDFQTELDNYAKEVGQ